MWGRAQTAAAAARSVTYIPVVVGENLLPDICKARVGGKQEQSGEQVGEEFFDFERKGGMGSGLKDDLKLRTNFFVFFTCENDKMIRGTAGWL